MWLRHAGALFIGFLLLLVQGCDRNVEPFVPGEGVEPPDLARIFPAGAERAAQESGAPQGSPGPAGGMRGTESSGPPITGTITLEPALSGRVPDGAVAFVMARVGASGPPLAVRRIPDPRLPLDFEIGPEDVMMASTPFVGSIRLSVRIDADGNATTRSPGDLEGEAAELVEPGASGVRIVIDEQL